MKINRDTESGITTLETDHLIGTIEGESVTIQWAGSDTKIMRIPFGELRTALNFVKKQAGQIAFITQVMYCGEQIEILEAAIREIRSTI